MSVLGPIIYEQPQINKLTSFRIIASVFILVVAICLLSWLTVMTGFTELEVEFAQEKIASSQEAIANRIKQLATEISDWSVWDDSYAFIENKNEEFIRSLFLDISFSML